MHGRKKQKNGLRKNGLHKPARKRTADRKPAAVTAAAVVEMAYIIPLILFLFLASLYAIFYYHDKAILNGAAAETAAVGAQAARTNGGEETDLEELFYERTDGKLIYMTSLQVETTQTDTEVTVSVQAENGAMSLSVCQKAVIVEPEEEIRWAN